jgi:hypothetical protein
MIAYIWKQSLQLWDFKNDESHKDAVRSVAEYKQQALYNKIWGACHQTYTFLHPMKPLQKQLLNIQIDEVLIMSYNIRKSWLQSASFYLQRAEAHDMLARGSENSFMLHFTVGRQTDATPL